jgi:hypothetical protein
MINSVAWLSIAQVAQVLDFGGETLEPEDAEVAVRLAESSKFILS